MNKKKIRIPGHVSQLFWDIKKESIDVKKHSAFIIKRILDYGDEKSLLWLRRTYKDALIKKVVKNKRGITEKTIEFWRAYYET